MEYPDRTIDLWLDHVDNWQLRQYIMKIDVEGMKHSRCWQACYHWYDRSRILPAEVIFCSYINLVGKMVITDTIGVEYFWPKWYFERTLLKLTGWWSLIHTWYDRVEYFWPKWDFERYYFSWQDGDQWYNRSRLLLIELRFWTYFIKVGRIVITDMIEVKCKWPKQISSVSKWLVIKVKYAWPKQGFEL